VSLAGELAKLLFAAGVGQAAAVEDEAAAVTGVVCRRLAVEGKLKMRTTSVSADEARPSKFSDLAWLEKRP
jgi:hypothetical protein